MIIVLLPYSMHNSKTLLNKSSTGLLNQLYNKGPCKIHSFTPSLRYADRSHQHGLVLVIGCTYSRSVGQATQLETCTLHLSPAPPRVFLQKLLNATPISVTDVVLLYTDFPGIQFTRNPTQLLIKLVNTVWNNCFKYEGQYYLELN